MQREEGETTMPDAPLDVVVAAFHDETDANEALTKLKEGQKAGVIKVKDAALLTKDADSKTEGQGDR
jgi:uncharacterized membrane protein